MADYYPLIARAVAGLEKNTGEARRALYERARLALVAQLRGVNPPLSENDVTRERLALEESIRKVEAEAARRTWPDPAQPAAPTRVRSPEFPRWEPPPPAADEMGEPSRPVQARVDPTAGRPAAGSRFENPAARQQATARALRAANPPPPSNTMLGGDRYVDPVFDQPLPAESESDMPRVVRPRPPAADRRSLSDDGLKDFRHVVSESDELGEAPARAVRSARDNYAAITPTSHDYDRIDARSLDPNAPPLPEYPAPPMLEQDHVYDDPRAAVGRGGRGGGAALERSTSRRSIGSVIRVAAMFLLLAGIGALLVWQWQRVAQLYSSVTAPAPKTEVTADSAPTKSKVPRINDRFEPSGSPSPKASPAAIPTPAGGDASVAQKVVLYEEDPSEPQGRRFVGSAVWRTERVPPTAGQPGEVLIRADVEIPDRKLIMTWSLKRNTDQSLPASHTVEILFRLPQDFPAGGVAQVPGILMKQSEQTRGDPLAGLAVKVTNGYFLIGLSAADGDRERNLQMLRNRAWFDIPVVYNNNRRAILAVEKGTPGERVFAEAFAAWQQ